MGAIPAPTGNDRGSLRFTSALRRLTPGAGRKRLVVMAGVGKLMKQAQKMQRKIEALQEELAAEVLEVSSGGGAVQVKINGQGEFMDLTVDPEFLKEDAEFVQETILEAVKEAAAKSKAYNEEKMGDATAGFQLPGLM